MPGQFKNLAPHLAKNENNNVMFLTKREDIKLPGIVTARYKKPRDSAPETHPYVRRLENAVRYGQSVARSLIEIERRAHVPDVIIAHPGWGEALYCKDIFPNVPLINFCEWYYLGRNSDVDFDPEESPTIDTFCRSRTRAAHLLMSLENCDAGVSPTHWQKSVHPEPFRDKIEVIFDGIDTNIVKPNPDAKFTLADGRELTRKDKVITYIARNLEPYRGFRTFMRSIPEMQKLHPDAEIIVIGGDEVSYGRPPTEEGFDTWREELDDEVTYDKTRVHFVGKVPYSRFLSMLQISSAHIYLTYPFVLSWSCVEAMACGTPIVASDTAPVTEFITDGENGLLTDFFDPKAVARRVDELLTTPEKFEQMRKNARAFVENGYKIDQCLPKWINLIDKVTGGKA
jgi:glycosyltransferase involved in cell wall biosynthesis